MAKSTTYNTSGNREDLTDIISVLEPEATPFVSMIKKGKATGTFFEYQVDKLNSPEFSGVSEGEDVTNFKNQSADRQELEITFKNSAIHSWCQIFKRWWIVQEFHRNLQMRKAKPYAM